MDFESKYNTKIPAVKRLMREACELRQPTEDYSAHPLQDNLFEWHFTVKGASGTEFEGGVYHGRIIFPNEYPMKPPNIILLTPNGRFETNKKICLSISGHHPETWQPSWSIRTALLALIAFMPSDGRGTLGSLDYSPEERKALARKSQQWACAECGPIKDELGESAATISQAESQMIKSVLFKADVGTTNKSSSGEPSSSQQMSSENTTTTATVLNTSAAPNVSVSSEPPLAPSGFYIDQRVADILIAVVVFLLAALFFRRVI